MNPVASTDQPISSFFDAMKEHLKGETINGRPLTEEELVEKICHIAESTSRCLLCGEQTIGIAIFIPGEGEQAAFGNFSKGKKLRQIFYGLCLWHQQYIGSQAVETKMREYFARMN